LFTVYALENNSLPAIQPRAYLLDTLTPLSVSTTPASYTLSYDGLDTNLPAVTSYGLVATVTYTDGTVSAPSTSLVLSTSAPP
jgi:hypothetical protein